MPKDLTLQQQMFVKEYLIDFNGTRAAIAAEYSKKGAGQQAVTLLRNPKIIDALYTASQQKVIKLEHTALDVALELAKIAFGDPRTLFDENGMLIPIQNMTPDQTVLIGGFDLVTRLDGSTTLKVKRNDKLRALELFGKHVTINAFNPDAPKGDDKLNLIEGEGEFIELLRARLAPVIALEGPTKNPSGDGE